MGPKRFEQGTRRRIAVRLLPFVFLMYIIAYLDRQNLATAALQMPHDLGLTIVSLGWAQASSHSGT